MIRDWSSAAKRVARAAGAIVLVVPFGCSDNGPSTHDLPSDGGDAIDGSSNGEASTGPAADSGTGPSSDANTDDAPRATGCTAPPFVSFAGTVSEITSTLAVQPLGGATIGFTSCSGFVVTTDATGGASTQVTQNVAFSPLFSSGSTINAIGAELSGVGAADVRVTLPRADVSDVIPEYDGAAPSFAIVLEANGQTAPCNAIDGVALAVTNHPEAVARYMAASWPSDKKPTTGAVSVGSYVFFTGLKTGLTVEVTGTKAGCAISTLIGSQTGRFSLVSGLVTIGRAVVSDP